MSTVRPEPLALEVALAHYVATLPEGKSVALVELAGELGCSVEDLRRALESVIEVEDRDLTTISGVVIGQLSDPVFLVIEQRPEGGDVDASDAIDRPQMQQVQDRKKRCFRFAPGRWGEDDRILACEHGVDGEFLHRAKLCPSEPGDYTPLESLRKPEVRRVDHLEGDVLLFDLRKAVGR